MLIHNLSIRDYTFVSKIKDVLSEAKSAQFRA